MGVFRYLLQHLYRGDALHVIDCFLFDFWSTNTAGDMKPPEGLGRVAYGCGRLTRDCIYGDLLHNVLQKIRKPEPAAYACSEIF